MADNVNQQQFIECASMDTRATLNYWLRVTHWETS